MGWTSGRDMTPDSIVREMVQTQTQGGTTWECLGHTLIDLGYNEKRLWLISQITRPEKTLRLVICVLMELDGDWAYKEISEDMGPCYYDCPLHFLDDLTEPTSDHARGWRERVRRHHHKSA